MGKWYDYYCKQSFWNHIVIVDSTVAGRSWVQILTGAFLRGFCMSGPCLRWFPPSQFLCFYVAWTPGIAACSYYYSHYDNYYYESSSRWQYLTSKASYKLTGMRFFAELPYARCVLHPVIKPCSWLCHEHG